MASETETESVKSVALIVGVTGIVGFSLAEAMRKPTAPGGPWRIYGAARRERPEWFPSSLLDGFIQLDALDRDDTVAKLSPIAHRVTHLFWVAVSIMTGTKHYMGPIGDPKYAGKLGSVDAPWREDTPRRHFPNFYYALEDIVALEKFLHLVCRYEGSSPFRFPGTRYAWEHFCDASDAGLLADQQLWVATTDAAKNQAFNCTNGDVFAWKSFWRVVAEALKVEFVDSYEEGFDLVEAMKEKGPVWDAIVKEHGLFETKMEELLTCFRAASIVLKFGFQHVCSMNKSREFGFLASVDTLKSIPVWIERMREMNLIPRR
ncbi:hypothetical protein H6P81_004111 [Aristolochia fimbriata]|uniref:Uncharacterized protein n=1 Tax=Aristolochia fimbriata TaxID=158543 RepID=A0AAV7FHS0_ARIFI|nr:hypothetical protein H6P81_004111 [Aristolochia fimbriata]